MHSKTPEIEVDKVCWVRVKQGVYKKVIRRRKIGALTIGGVGVDTQAKWESKEQMDRFLRDRERFRPEGIIES